jgi:enoyl-CoA hydratase
MAGQITTETDGKVARVTINRPDNGNRVTNPMAVDLTQLFGELGKTAQIIVLRGAGGDFCLGRDAGPPPGPMEALDMREETDVIFDCYGAFRKAPVPIVGVVQGRALGFGCALAALCDITIAAEDARFALPEMGHNIYPNIAFSSLIDRVSRKGALYLVYSTEEVSAAVAQAYGLVSKVVPKGDLDKALATLLAAMLKAPMPATRAVKDYARHAFTTDAATAIDLARNLHSVVNSSRRMRK